MKVMKVVLVAVFVMCAVSFLESRAFAGGPGVYICNVLSAGIVRESEILIDLTHNEDGKASEFTNLRFTAQVGREKEMLAVALTALSTNTRVRVWSDPDQGTTALRILTSMFSTAQSTQ